VQRSTDDTAAREEHELATALRGGGRTRVLEVLYRQHAGRAFRYCLRLLGNPAAAEEVAQDAFVKALGCVGWLRRPEPAALRAYLYRTAHHLALTRLRRRGAEERALARLDLPPAATTPSEGPDAERVRSALGALAEHHRTILLLWADAELPLAEVARVLEIPESTCRDHFRAALDALAASIGCADEARQSPRDLERRARGAGGGPLAIELAALRLGREP